MADNAPPDKLRIAFVSAEFWPKIGGAEIQALRLGQKLIARGHEAVVYTATMRGQQPGLVYAEGLPVHRHYVLPVPRLRNLTYILAQISILWRRRHSYDVLHAVSALRPAYGAALLGKWLNKPVVIYIASGREDNHDALVMQRGTYGDAFRRLDPFLWRTIRGADRFQATTDEVAAGLRQAGVADWQIARIPTGVPVPDRPASVGPTDAPTVICVSRLDPVKGVDVLLRAVPSLPGNARLLVAGDGPQRPALDALHAELGLGERLTLLGRRDDVPALLAHSTVFVLPSHIEGMSNALLEAMSFGLPCVATDIGGNRALLDHDADGLLVPPGDPPALAAAVQALLDDPARRERLGAAARAKVIAHYGLDANCAQFEALYRTLIAEKRQSNRR